MSATLRRALAGLAGMAILSGVACSGSPEGSTSPTPVLTGYNDWQITVNAGGDCRAAQDDFRLFAEDRDGRGTHEVGFWDGQPTMLSPGVVPCPFTFTFEDVPVRRRYLLVDVTQDRGWGPWARASLAASGWKVTVDITDLD